MIIRLASFDIGRCNFAQYVEDFDSECIFSLEKRYKNLPKNQQRRVKGVMNSNIKEILQETSLCGDRVSTGVYDFTTEKCQGLDIPARLRLLSHLSRFEELWNTCDIFVIEQQYFTTFGKKSSGGANIDAIKVAETVFMWFLERYPFKTITYFGSQFKTQIFGANWKMSKIQRKNWAVEKTKEIYTDRDDKEMQVLFDLAEAVKRKRIKTEERVESFLNNYSVKQDDTKELANKIVRDKQKLDDISDAFMQAQAFKFRFMVGCF